MDVKAVMSAAQYTLYDHITN